MVIKYKKNPSKLAEPTRLVVKRAEGIKFPKMKIDGPDAAMRAAQSLIADSTYEAFVVIYVDTRNKIIGYEELTEDSINSVNVNSASLVRNALLAGAVGIITIHNHPSGDPTPSGMDEALWATLDRQCELMGITLLDNFIVTEYGYYSEKEAA